MQQLDLLRLSLSLVLVVILILVAAWLARRTGLLRNRGQASIQIIASQSLGGRNSIVVVEIEKQRLVLGITQQQINLLHTLPIPPTEFNTQLRQAMSQNAPPEPTEPTKHSENTPS